MAEDRYDYNMAAAIDTLIEETTALEELNAEKFSSLQALAQESREMRAAVEENTASQDSGSGSSSSESLTLDLSASKSLESFGEGSKMDASIGELYTAEAEESGIGQDTNQSMDSLQDDAQRNEEYKKAVENLVIRLRGWRMVIEDAKYKDINFDAPLNAWTRKERIIMRNEIRLMSYELRKKTIINKMLDLNKSQVFKSAKETKLAMELMEVLLQDIVLLRVIPFKDVVFPLTRRNIYDWDKISQAVKRRHSPVECQEFWYTKFHPGLNGTCWSKAENHRLVALADAYKLHWDKIAEQLETNRTGFQCFVQYRRYLYKKKPVVVKEAQKKAAKDRQSSA